MNPEARIAQLEAENARLQAIVDSLPDLIFFLDRDCRFTHVQPAPGLMAPPDQIVGRTIQDFFSPDVAELTAQRIEMALAQGEAQKHGYSVDMPDGTRCQYEGTVVPYGEGEVLYLSRDVTEARRREAEAEELAAVLRNMQDMVVISSMNPPITTYINDVGAAMLGAESADEVVGQLIDPFQPEEAAQQFYESASPYLLNGEGWRGETLLRRKNGEVFPVDYNGFPLIDPETGETYAIAAIITDITRRKQQQEQLETFKTIVEKANDGIAISDMTGAFTYGNRALHEIYGYDYDQREMQRLHIPDIWLPEHHEYLNNTVLPTIMTEGRWQKEYEGLRKDGSRAILMSHVFPVMNADGQPVGMAAHIRDMTEERAMQAERERLQQEIIEGQRQALRELSTPIIPLMDGIVVIPLIGTIDTQRAREITRSLLAGITQNRARTIILDITGVPIVDSGVADHLNKSIQAARLKGARTIVTGISDAVAETIVDLGIDWSGVDTLRDLQSGLLVAMQAG